MRVRLLVTAVALCALVRAPADVSAQRGGMFRGSLDDPAIAYSTAAVNNAVSRVNAKLGDGSARLAFEGRSGYLRSALAALDIPIESQVLVFSPTSFQRRRIDETNPRAIFFNDRVALGWVRDGEIIEVAAHDEHEGVVFYTLDQRPMDQPEFRRAFTCLGCHMAGDTVGVPGLLMFSTTSSGNDGPTRSVFTDHRSPLGERWGGWYVTGGSGRIQHRGNETSGAAARSAAGLSSVSGFFDPDGYQSMSSDIGALMVLSHQVHMTNLLTRAGWEARAADPSLHPPFVAAPEEARRVAQVMSGIAGEVVDYLLFIDEAPLTSPIRASQEFVRRFQAAGPRDARNRSLYELDLRQRLLKYPCSYMIYSAAFDGLPPVAKDSIYRRMWDVLSGRESDSRYRSALSPADRQAIVDIVRATKNDLPGYFQTVQH